MAWEEYNEAQRRFVEWAEAKGWRVVKSGWPDYLCETPGGMLLVEVKPTASTKLMTSQREMLALLSAHGLDCRRWVPSGGLTPWDAPTEAVLNKEHRRTTKWIKCAGCGVARRVYRHGRYCGNACRQRAYRRRRVPAVVSGEASAGEPACKGNGPGVGRGDSV